MRCVLMCDFSQMKSLLEVILMAKEAQNDTVFREEQNHLDSTKAAIQSLLDGYEQKVHEGEKELSSGNRYNDK